MITDLLSGTRSPVVPSPPPDQAIVFDQSVFSPANSTFSDKPPHHSVDFTGIQKKDGIAPILGTLFQTNQDKHQMGSSK